MNERSSVGNLKISEDVIATIAGVAALEIEGVQKLSLPQAHMPILRKISKKAIDVAMNDDSIEIDIRVVLKFGAKITEVSAAIQSAVKESVQTMTGMAVSKINVLIDDIAFSRETQPQINQ